MIMSTGILRCIEIFSEPSYYAYSDLIQFFLQGEFVRGPYLARK